MRNAVQCLQREKRNLKAGRLHGSSLTTDENDAAESLQDV